MSEMPANTLAFFIYEIFFLSIVLSIGLTFFTYIRVRFLGDRLAQSLDRKPKVLVYAAMALLGIVSPFCSCSAIPAFMALSALSLPTGALFVYLVVAPLVQETSMILLLTEFGIPVTIVYIIQGVVAGVIAGLILSRASDDKLFTPSVLKNRLNGAASTKDVLPVQGGEVASCRCKGDESSLSEPGEGQSGNSHKCRCGEKSSKTGCSCSCDKSSKTGCSCSGEKSSKTGCSCSGEKSSKTGCSCSGEKPSKTGCSCSGEKPSKTGCSCSGSGEKSSTTGCSCKSEKSSKAGGGCSCDKSSVDPQREPLNYSIREAMRILKNTFKYILIGVTFGALIHGVIPEDVIVWLLGTTNYIAPIYATLIGIPIYADDVALIPIAKSLLDSGAALGTALSFVMASAVVSIPSFILLSSVLQKKVIIRLVFILIVVIIANGYLFNALQPILL